MSLSFDWCRCGEHIWPHRHRNPADPHDIEVIGEDEDDGEDVEEALDLLGTRSRDPM